MFQLKSYWVATVVKRLHLSIVGDGDEVFEYFKTLDSKAQSRYKQQLDMLGGIPDPYLFVPLTIDYLNYGRVV